jgi:hypothetical protein
MIELVTLDQARAMLQMTHTAQDGLIVNYIQAASKMVLNYLKLDETAYLNSDGAMEIDSDLGYQEVPSEVQAATLYLIGVLFRDRDGAESEKWIPGYLPGPCVSMLYNLRDPTLA